jgi:hypothetical protein
VTAGSTVGLYALADFDRALLLARSIDDATESMASQLAVARGALRP